MDPQYYNAHSSYSHYPYYPPPPPSHQPQNPNSQLTHYETIQPTNTTIHPPGVDSSYSSLNSYHLPSSSLVVGGGYDYEPLPQSTTLSYAHLQHQSSQLPATLSTASYFQDPSVLQSLAAKEAVRHYGASLPHGGYASDLETKRRKVLEGGAANESVMVCSICNIVCNSQVVFNAHLAGKKHAIQAGTIPANPIPNSWMNSVVQSTLNKAKRKSLKKPKIVQSAWCEICSVDCNSEDVLKKHKMGKKHQKQLDKLNEARRIANTPASTSKVTNPIIGPQANPASNTVGNSKAKKKSASALEDVETKRQKVVSGGAAAEAVKVCGICNVVCNSQTVFNFHLAGQKHASMMKKLAEAGRTAAPGS